MLSGNGRRGSDSKREFWALNFGPGIFFSPGGGGCGGRLFEAPGIFGVLVFASIRSSP